MSNPYKVVESMLYNYRTIVIEIKNIELDIEALENEYQGINPISYEEKTSSSNQVSSIVENEVINKEEKIRYLKSLKRSKEIQIERIDNTLTLLTDDEYKLIELRYFKKLQFKEIADILCKNEVYLITLRKKIINKLIPLIKTK